MVLDKEVIKDDSIIKHLNHYRYSKGQPSWVAVMVLFVCSGNINI